MNIIPLYDRVLIKRESEEQITSGGIVLPGNAQEKPMQGEVISVGKGKILDNGQLLNLSVKKGDKVLFGKYSGSEVKINGETLLIMKEDDILGIIINK